MPGGAPCHHWCLEVRRVSASRTPRWGRSLSQPSRGVARPEKPVGAFLGRPKVLAMEGRRYGEALGEPGRGQEAACNLFCWLRWG